MINLAKLHADAAEATELDRTHTDAQRPFQVLPIDFPDPEVLERARERRQRIERSLDEATTAAALRMQQAVTAARRNALDEGHTAGWKAGFKTGTHWGMLCGALATLLIGGMVIVAVMHLVGIRHL